MVRRPLATPDPEPRIRLVVPAHEEFSAVAATAAEVLLAGHVQTAGSIVDAARTAVAAVIGRGDGKSQLEIEISRSGNRLTMVVPTRCDIQGDVRTLADRLEATPSRLALVWDLPQM
jgi:hypothetical protein